MFKCCPRGRKKHCKDGESEVFDQVERPNRKGNTSILIRNVYSSLRSIGVKISEGVENVINGGPKKGWEGGRFLNVCKFIFIDGNAIELDLLFEKNISVKTKRFRYLI